MVSKYPKFVIQGNHLIIGKVAFHKDMVNFTGDKMKGGGWFDFHLKSKTFTFYGESVDFGKATIEDIKECIKLGYVGNLVHYRMYSDFNFYYDMNGDGKIIINLN